MLDFLDLPSRSLPPRNIGITHVIDRGIGLRAQADLLDTCGQLIDIVKLGWGTGYVTGGLERKVRIYQEAGIRVCFGGTLTEVAIAQGKLDAFRKVLDQLSIGYIEISNGVLPMTLEEKVGYIRELVKDFVVLSEVGSKDIETVVAPSQWIREILRTLCAGAWKVILEARESGTVGLYRQSGEIRMGLIEDIVSEIDVEHLIFEAPRKAQQVWLIKQFGRNVNLGNIAIDDVIPLETLRLGLRGDTLEFFHLRDEG
jgi:phosphosulfolactate synthase